MSISPTPPTLPLHSHLLHPNINPPFPTPSSDIASRTASIARLARRNNLSAAATEFSSMLSSSSPPNHITFITILSACADFPSSPFSIPLAQTLHSLAVKLSLLSSPRSHLQLTTALIDFYLNAGFPAHAHQLFDRMPQPNIYTYNAMIAGHMKNAQINQALDIFHRMPDRDLISWTAVIDGCVKNGCPEDALEHFRRMLVDNVDPDYVTAIAVAAACSDLGALAHGMWLHYFAIKRGIEGNVRVGNALIDMYSKCGRVDYARKVFNEMPKRTIVSWNSMIMGLAVNGFSSEAISLFSEMQSTEFEPDSVSFTAALTSCSHAGLLDDGLHLFQLMQRKYRVVARAEHYGCLVDMLARAGRLEEAKNLIEQMPVTPNEVMMGSVLAACRARGEVRLAERMAGLLMEVEVGADSNYVLLSNAYAATGRWEGVGRVRGLMKKMGLKKKPGFSVVEIGCEVHHFVAGDVAHGEIGEIYDMLHVIHFDMEFCGLSGVFDKDFYEGYID